MPMKKKMQLVNIGILVIFIGFMLVFIGLLNSGKESSSAKVAVGGFIGFIPFGFGNDRNMVWFATILSAAVFLLWLFFSFRIKP